MHTLICGSIAYDTIMVFRDRFKHHILPDQIHILNVSFLVPDLRREFGGCAGNIAYNLKLLGGKPADHGHGGRGLSALRVPARAPEACPDPHPSRSRTAYTAQAFITTDLDDNQITAFHPGAMNYLPSEPRRRCQGRQPRHRRAGWPRGHAQPRTRVQGGGYSLHLRPGPGSAHVQRRGIAGLRPAGFLRGCQRLRGPSAAGANRSNARSSCRGWSKR